MDRKEWLKITAALGAGALIPKEILAAMIADGELKRSDFGKDFVWGTATVAYQIEGGWNEDGKGESIWDHFTHKKGNVKTGENGDVACDFYHRYESDIELMRKMNIPASRFSIGWSRVLPQGTGAVNQKGIDYYHRVIDKCLKEQVEPWVTCYHWDLPQALENKGGLPSSLQPVLMGLERDQEEAAFTLGASPWITFWKVTVPSILPGLLTGVFLTFVRALGEFGSIVIVAGNIPMKTQVDSVYVYGEIESYNPQAATSVSVLILLISFLVLLLLERLTRRPGELLPRLFQWTPQKDRHGSESAVPTAAV